MLEYYKLYLPKCKREVKIEVSVPRIKQGITFDTIYFLDGQNAFKDSHAAFGRSIRAAKTLGHAAREMGKRILGVAVYNSGSDLGRINEYTPFKIKNIANPEWEKQDLKECENFCDDFIHAVIPFIEKKYQTYESEDHRAIYGSSLSAITAIYLSLKYKNSFKYVGAFSTPTFLFDEAFDDFIDKNIKDRDIFLYVGKQEQSDNIYDKGQYYFSSFKLFEKLKKENLRVRLSVDANGVHNEETWGKHIPEFLSFIYFDDITYTL